MPSPRASTALSRNKRAMTLNLKDPKGLHVFQRLAEKAEVVVENFRPDVKARLGIDYESLRQINPRIVYGSISGFGQNGPYHKRPGFDQIAPGMGGFMSITLQRAGVAHPTDHSHTTRGCAACERRRAKPRRNGAVIVADLRRVSARSRISPSCAHDL